MSLMHGASMKIYGS